MRLVYNTASTKNGSSVKMGGMFTKSTYIILCKLIGCKTDDLPKEYRKLAKSTISEVNQTVLFILKRLHNIRGLVIQHVEISYPNTIFITIGHNMS